MTLRSTPRAANRALVATIVASALPALAGEPSGFPEPTSPVVGIRLSVTSADPVTREAVIAVTRLRPGDVSTSGLDCIDSIDWSDGAPFTSTTLTLTAVVGTEPGQFHGSFRHVDGSPGFHAVRVRSSCCWSEGHRDPVAGSPLESSAWGHRVDTSVAAVTTATVRPCAFNPFHGAPSPGRGGCLPICVVDPFDPSRHARVPCLADCSVESEGGGPGPCVRTDAQPGASSRSSTPGPRDRDRVR